MVITYYYICYKTGNYDNNYQRDIVVGTVSKEIWWASIIIILIYNNIRDQKMLLVLFLTLATQKKGEKVKYILFFKKNQTRKKALFSNVLYILIVTST